MSTDTSPGFSDLVGLTLSEVEAGSSHGTVTVTDQLKNPNGVVHGAVMYTMADTGMGAALQAGLDEGELCATIEIKINYLRPVEEGTVACESTLVDRGGSVAYLESELTHEGDTVARATGSFSIFSP